MPLRTFCDMCKVEVIPNCSARIIHYTQVPDYDREYVLCEDCGKKVFDLLEEGKQGSE